MSEKVRADELSLGDVLITTHGREKVIALCAMPDTVELRTSLSETLQRRHSLAPDQQMEVQR